MVILAISAQGYATSKYLCLLDVGPQVKFQQGHLKYIVTGLHMWQNLVKNCTKIKLHNRSRWSCSKQCQNENFEAKTNTLFTNIKQVSLDCINL